MRAGVIRGVVVGASSLLGKELAEELASAPSNVWDLVLVDDVETGGQMTAAGEEALLIQPVSRESFLGADVVFFAGDAGQARKHGDEAQAAGAAIVDLSGGLEGRNGMVLRSPWVSEDPVMDLTTVGVVSAGAAALMLAVVAKRLQGLGPGVRLIATVLQPVSEQGSAGVDELHRQTVNLLSFQPLSKEIFDAQVAFSVRAELGPNAKAKLKQTGDEVRRQFAALLGDDSVELALQMLQAPVFHGCTASLFVEAGQVDAAEVARLLDGGVLRKTKEEGDEPSNEAAAGQREILVAVAINGEQAGRGGVWVWMAGDNLRLAAHHAAVCAGELAGLRPQGEIQ